VFVFAAFHIPLTWSDLLKRTAKDTVDDDCLGQAAQLAYYFFLALFPAVLFLLALASFLPLDNFIDQVVAALRPIAPREMLEFIEVQLRRVANTESGGLLTMGILGAVWSSSAALVAIVSSLNRAYDIEEARPWWKVRLTAIGLTLALATFVLIAFALIIVGPMLAERLAVSFGLGAAFEWTWKILQWPLVFVLVSTAVGLVYYFGPDAEQDWIWVTPGAVLGTILWMLVSLAFKFYVANFADYNATYGTVGGVIVLLLWFYISGLAILVGAEMNAEIEHASPHGKNPGEKVPGQRKKIGMAAARAYMERLKATATTQGESIMATTNATTNTTANNGRTLGEMFADLSRETRTLIQQEIRLAKSELSEKASHIAKGAGLVVVGGLTAYGGLLAVIAAAVLVLTALGLAPWAGALLVGVVAIGGGYLLVRSGLDALNPRELVPHKTVETIKEDAEWLKAQAK
jgi:membrane protein